MRFNSPARSTFFPTRRWPRRFPRRCRGPGGVRFGGFEDFGRVAEMFEQHRARTGPTCSTMFNATRASVVFIKFTSHHRHHRHRHHLTNRHRHRRRSNPAQLMTKRLRPRANFRTSWRKMPAPGHSKTARNTSPVNTPRQRVRRRTGRRRIVWRFLLHAERERVGPRTFQTTPACVPAGFRDSNGLSPRRQDTF